MSSVTPHTHIYIYWLFLTISSFIGQQRQPIKAAVAATAEHLAGLLPLHLVYSQAHETSIEVHMYLKSFVI